MRRTTVVIALFAFVLVSGLLMAASKPIVGTWECVANSPQGEEVRFTMKVSEEGGKLAGAATFGEGGEVTLTDPKYEAGNFTFKVTLDSGTYEVSLKLAGDKLDGNYKGPDASGPIKGSRKV